MGTTPEPPRGGVGRLFSPSHTPPSRSHSRSQDGTPSKAKVASAARPRPGHLLPRSCHSRLPRPHPPACLGPRWGPTLRARAPQRQRENGTWRPSRGKPKLGGRCKQLVERRAGRVDCSGSPRPALSPAQSPAPRPHKPRPQAGLRPCPLSGSSSHFRVASVSWALDPAVRRASALTESQAVETLAR